ncbi:WD40-repeat-containing domain protein [Pavlovales sp. CCMP2436]|nr:WD40-repeat-containing domain protein [Pavlovales sp. CCMP2436]
MHVSDHMSLLYEPKDRFHTVSSKMNFQPGSSQVLLVPFSSGCVRLFDLRVPSKVVIRVALELFSGANDVKFRPWSSSEFAVGCDDESIRLCDLRYPSSPTESVQLVAKHTQSFTPGTPGSTASAVSGLCWNRSGQQLLVNFRSADPALFNLAAGGASGGPSQLCEPAATGAEGRAGKQVPTRQLLPLQTYAGRENVETCCKEAVFLLGEDCVASGGDCGALFVWKANSGELVRRIVSDRCVVNCVAPHPFLPLLAVSGIDDNVKLFDVGASAQRTHDDEPARAAGGQWQTRLSRETGFKRASDCPENCAGLSAASPIACCAL